ncbi:PilZ domain-containing protein [Desulfomicrobium apsheronum]|uniref:PilZ domain-containing protein n=1 Tax=Desulfomicrobium apsheronum TaxID=52560 RepID=A0A1I3YAJ7_9BACT|nr:PilZ domain-containing protein [Desulfomicrobium apsheronum]MDY0227948.1 PilZ domain-containing protein [Desulfomicrobium apsheronum]SFK28997.1 PilZ domain-containing protein [Desulfomicrobium apsheronum]
MNSKVGQGEQGAKVERTAEDSSLLIACDNDGKKVVRKSFRVPVPHGLVTMNHDGLKHSVKDLSMYGIGLSVTSPDAFVVGSVLNDVQIVFPDRSFHVDVRIVHISPYEGETLICGMEIVHTHDSGYIDWMTRVVSEIKSSVLSSVTKPS